MLTERDFDLVMTDAILYALRAAEYDQQAENAKCIQALRDMTAARNRLRAAYAEVLALARQTEAAS